MPAPLEISCDVEQGFAFSNVMKKSFGYLSSLVVGEKALKPDIIGAEPLPARAAVMGAPPMHEKIRTDLFNKSIVGVVSSVSWDGGHSDPLELAFNVSPASWRVLDLEFRTKIDTSTRISFAVVIYKWDYVYSRYFVRFCTGGKTDPTPCEGFIYSADISSERAADKTLDVSISDTPSQDSGGFLSYEVSMKLVPPGPGSEQLFHIATSLRTKAQFRWFEEK